MIKKSSGVVWVINKSSDKEGRLRILLVNLAVKNIASKVARLADGPDEVHRDRVGRLEIAKYN